MRVGIATARLAIVGLVLLGATVPAAAQVEVFTIAGEPVTHVPDAATVTEIDRPSRLDKQLSQGLSAQSDAAAATVQDRLQDMKAEYGQAYRGLLRAWQLGVTKVPAVVVDGQYVVYGEPDVAAALREIRHAENDS